MKNNKIKVKLVRYNGLHGLNWKIKSIRNALKIYSVKSPKTELRPGDYCSDVDVQSWVDSHNFEVEVCCDN